MTTTVSDVLPLRDAGQTNAEIAATLLGRRWTVQPIAVSALIDWLRENRVDGVPVARFDVNGSWEGVLPNLIAGEQIDAVLRDSLVELLSHLRNSKAEAVRTNADNRGVLLHQTAAACRISADQRATLYALGGGERFADATEPRVAALIAADDLRAKYREVHSSRIVPVLDGENKTTADLVAAFRAAADDLEAA